MPRAASSEMGAQAREPLDVTARQQKWTQSHTAGWGHPAQAQPAGTQRGSGQPGGGHWETCSEEAAVLWDCLGIPLPRG